MLQDKYLQKVHFTRHGIPLPEFTQVNDLVKDFFVQFLKYIWVVYIIKK